LLLIFRDNLVYHRNIECTLSNASRRDRNGTIGVCVPFTVLSYPFSQSPIIELLTPRDSFESLVANKHFLVGAQIPSLARLKNNVCFFADKLCVHYTFPSVFQLPLFLSVFLSLSLSLSLSYIRTHTNMRIHSLSVLSLSFFFFSLSLSLPLIFDNQANGRGCLVSRCAKVEWHGHSIP